MKKFFIICITFLLVGCSGSNTSVTDAIISEKNGSNSLEDVAEIPRATNNAAEPEIVYEPDTEEIQLTHMADDFLLEPIAMEELIIGEVFDLTSLNGMMLYSQLYDMVMNGQKYDGEIVKLQGLYDEFDYSLYYEGYDLIERAVVVFDPITCCAIGTLLEWESDVYPQIGDLIEVTGTFHRNETAEWIEFHIDVHNATIVQANNGVLPF